jgi:hypothetical protein
MPRRPLEAMPRADGRLPPLVHPCEGTYGSRLLVCIVCALHTAAAPPPDDRRYGPLVRSLRQALAPLPELERSMTFKYHIFLSHSSQNKPIARLVAHELKHAGFDVWFDEWMIALGDDIFLEIERGIEQSRAIPPV